MRRAGRPARLVLALAATLAGSSCANDAPHPASLDAAKVASIVVGRSSRSDVFAILGRPVRTERSAQGETWIYEVDGGSGGGGRLVNGAAAASGIVGAFVPYVGLLGSGLGLADAATSGARPRAATASLAVSFGAGDVVRDCAYATTAFPAAPGKAPGLPEPVDCQRAPGGGLPATAVSPAPGFAPPAQR